MPPGRKGRRPDELVVDGREERMTRAEAASRTGLLRMMAACFAVAVTVATAGCYDAESLIAKVNDEASRMRLEEVELGVYRTTLPRTSDSMATVTLELELFGFIAKKDVPDVQVRLSEAESLMRHDILVAVRQSTADEFADPELQAVRTRVLQVANDLLEGEPIQSIGLKSMTYLED